MRSRPPIDPNVVTTLRLPLAPLAVACMVTDTVTGVIAAAVLAMLLELTDLLDGRIARAYGMVTDFGKLYDPFSDALTRFTLFLGLYAIGVADLWMIIAIFYRDTSISFFRSIAAIRNVVVAARPSGKIKATVQGLGTQVVFACLVAEKLDPTLPLDAVPWWTMLFITIVTVWSFGDYLMGTWPMLRDAWTNRPNQ